MNEDCKAIISHLSRIQGQINTLKKYVEDDESCEKVVQLTSSVFKSVDSAKAKIVETYLKREFLKDEELKPRLKKDLELLLKLIKK